MDQKAGNVLGVLSDNRALSLVLIGLVVVIAAAIIVDSSLGVVESYDNEALSHSGELRVLSQELSTNATEAASGQSAAFDLLASSIAEFEQRWGFISKGNPQTGLPPIAEQFPDINVNAFNNAWVRTGDAARTIVDSRDSLLDISTRVTALSNQIPRIQEDYEIVVERLLATGASAEQVALAQRQLWLSERIVSSTGSMSAASENALKSAEMFATDTIEFNRVLTGMLQGSDDVTQVTDEEAVSALVRVGRQFNVVTESVNDIMGMSANMLRVSGAAELVFSNSQLLLQEATSIDQQIQAIADSRSYNQNWTAIFGAIAVAFIAGLVFVLARGTKRDVIETAETNEQNQNAILRLLDELADLADGDLTTQATVTEDFTGAIADSINFAIDQMRSLVSSINLTSVQVSSAAQETQATAMHLAEASEHQAQEIAGASAAVNEMAVSIDQVSANASESTAVAERSVAIAKKGTDVVQATINGMDNIREQIQETSKRIKRLGESSQEIGDIVSLINDIADQTNILALNAAIQASMAGDAGRGFAVVADEVQRLAERSSAATKQIEALVKTIQNDTNEAVISMEQTVAEVVRGARLAQDAGVALEEIENVSTNLADLIQNISNAARQQASSAGHISNTMNVIQEITSQTSAGTTATAKSIGNLAQLANDLQSSVAGFKLPVDEDDTDVFEIPELDEEIVSIS